jgi:ascorbate-specific PTS system EIIC-type component UlaA
MNPDDALMDSNLEGSNLLDNDLTYISLNNDDLLDNNSSNNNPVIPELISILADNGVCLAISICFLSIFLSMIGILTLNDQDTLNLAIYYTLMSLMFSSSIIYIIYRLCVRR